MCCACLQAQTALARGRVCEPSTRQAACSGLSAPRKLRYNFVLTEGHGNVVHSRSQPRDCGCFTHWPQAAAHGRASAARGQPEKLTAACKSCSQGHLGAVQVPSLLFLHRFGCVPALLPGLTTLDSMLIVGQCVSCPASPDLL